MARKLFAVVATVALCAFGALAQELPLTGMAQVSRSDGLVTWLVLGSFKDRDTCTREVQTFVANFIQSAEQAGFTAQQDMAACDTRIPKGTEFDALRSGAPTKRYVFFHPSIRIANYHPRGNAEYERGLCELTRASFASRLNIQGRCNPPSQ